MLTNMKNWIKKALKTVLLELMEEIEREGGPFDELKDKFGKWIREQIKK